MHKYFTFSSTIFTHSILQRTFFKNAFSFSNFIFLLENGKFNNLLQSSLFLCDNPRVKLKETLTPCPWLREKLNVASIYFYHILFCFFSM